MKGMDYSELSSKDERFLQDYVLIAFYYLYPLRADLADLKISSGDDERHKQSNYLVIRSKKIRKGKSKYMFHFNQFKPSKSMDPIVIHVTDLDFVKLLNIYLKQFPKE
jgi:hypothetical protein